LGFIVEQVEGHVTELHCTVEVSAKEEKPIW